ncbi:MBL fold metallo-hydrolase RNA specificity domain-containing protein [Usitatibacter palustris]|uniref:Ribonuclease n=1 Tax=Usitatibacter palustris TaxID=2732487 RepID=A0A6M4H4S6_9PROT|nr:MBL fold metallo-hydrolase [Usitatibacter palustris]QJR14175.1 Ribonuclease [Usitatibacter palustris]
MKLTFCGATGTVTGSRYLLRGDGGEVLVDCGLFQGYKQLRLRNWEAPPFAPKQVEAVLLSHAHLDHSGWIPRLVKAGFAGRVHCTPGTRDLCALLLPDSGHLQEEEAAYARRKGFSKHDPPQPLYTVADALAAMRAFRVVSRTRAVHVAGLEASFLHAGHLLGASSILVRGAGVSVMFSGDLGRDNDPILVPPAPFAGADYLVVESTYGNRSHDAGDREARLADVITRTVERGGIVVVPAFAVGRAQEILLHIARLRAAGRIPDVPVYLNSPMASHAGETLANHVGEHRLTAAQCAELTRIARIVATPEESAALNARRDPMIIVAASGMVTGGRVVHHVKAFAPDPRNTLLFCGYQAGGTRGATIVAGSPTVRIHGEDIPVRAEVVSLDGFSAHADADGLIAWMRAARTPPLCTFITHGEPDAADALRQRIERELGWNVRVPDYRDRYELTASGARSAGR